MEITENGEGRAEVAAASEMSAGLGDEYSPSEFQMLRNRLDLVNAERDRYKEALLEIHDQTRGDRPGDWPVIGIIRRALHVDDGIE